MIKNYLTVMVRNMVKNKLFTLINLAGLSVSLACCLLLFFYTVRELTYDTHHGTEVYRLTCEVSQKDGQVFKLATNSVPVAAVLQQEVPEIKYAGRMASSAMFGGKNVIRHEENSWYIENGSVVDTTLFNILKYHFIRGNHQQPLAHSNAIILEKEWSEKIFGQEEPLGKIIKLSTDFGEADFEVTAVYDQKTYRNHANPSYMVSSVNHLWNNFFNRDITNWIGNNMVFNYLRLDPESDPQVVLDKINAILEKNGGEEMKVLGLYKKMVLQPVHDIHTTEGYMINIPNTTSLVFIRVLVLIGILILVLACVNYINLSTAQAGKRALEVGIRKVMGVSAHGLRMQFLGESFLLVMLSLLTGLLIAWLVLPAFNRLIDMPLEFSPGFLPVLVLFLSGFLLFTALVSGIYPAFYLAGFKPSLVIKGRGKDRGGAKILRQGLVVFQFVISISLIISILIIYRQVNFIKNKEMGFTASSRLVIPLRVNEATHQYENFRKEFSSIAAVKQVSGSDGIPGLTIMNDLLVYRKGQTMEDAVHIYNNSVDLDFVDVLGIKIVSGKNFQDYNRDTTRSKILVSEACIQALSLPLDQAPGEILYFDWQGTTYEMEIVGVVNDIHQFSLHQAMDPMMYTIGGGERYQYLIMEADFTQFQDLIKLLEAKWKKVLPNVPFEYFTLSDNLLTQYKKDFNTFNLISYFAIISVIISCLGLYAMSMFLAERKTREIGIRKTFGARVSDIFIMVTSDISKLVLIAYLVAIPLSWYAMNRWLETFIYRITPGAGIFLMAGMISLLIGLITISYQSIRAAHTNPVNVLREE